MVITIIKNKETWEKVLNSIGNLIDQNDDVIMFGSATYEERFDDLDLCIIFEIKDKIDKNKIMQKEFEISNQLNIDIDILYTTKNRIEKISQENFTYNFLFRTGKSISGLDYSSMIDNQFTGEAYFQIESTIIMAENEIEEESDQELYYFYRNKLEKVLALYISLENTQEYHDKLYSLYKEIRDIFGYMDDKALLNYTKAIKKQLSTKIKEKGHISVGS